jgi:hypothetical protein
LLTAVQTDIGAKAVAWVATTEYLFDFSDLIGADLIRVNLYGSASSAPLYGSATSTPKEIGDIVSFFMSSKISHSSK